MPAAGPLDRLVTIEALTRSQSETGEPTEDWTFWREEWMGKHDIRADERFRANQELAAETTVWVSHWIEGLTPEHRLVVEGKTYDILGIAEVGRRAGLEITGQAVRL